MKQKAITFFNTFFQPSCPGDISNKSHSIFIYFHISLDSLIFPGFLEKQNMVKSNQTFVVWYKLELPLYFLNLKSLQWEK